MYISKNGKAISTLFIVLLVVGIIVLIVGAVLIFLWVAPGNLKTETLEFNGFSSVEASSTFQVVITQSESYSVKISAGENVFNRIRVTQDGQTLKLEVTPGIFFGALNAAAEISMPSLNRLELSGATHTVTNGFNSSDQLTAVVSGASVLELNDFSSGDLDLEVSGASHVKGKGVGRDLASVVSGASNLDFTNFQVNDATIDLSGASHATIKLNGRLDVQASGASSLDYIGEPTLGTINTTGASSINKK